MEVSNVKAIELIELAQFYVCTVEKRFPTQSCPLYVGKTASQPSRLFLFCYIA